MKLPDMISSTRIELQDQDSVLYEDSEITRAIEKSVGLMSRFIPRRTWKEVTITRTITSESLTIASSTGTLAYKPIKVGSVVLTGKVLDTDYTIDYLTGIITEIGSNLADASYTVSYSLADNMLDLEGILEDYIKIEKVEYPIGEASPTYIVPSDIYGSTLIFKAGTVLTEDTHLRIIYLTYWNMPTEVLEGNYPKSLDNSIIVGSAGQALIFKAEKYIQAATTEVEGIATLLDTIDALSLVAPALVAPVVPTLADITDPTLYTIVKPTSPTLPDAPTAPIAPTLSFTAAEGALDEAETSLAAGTDYLTTGSAKIDISNTGKDVGYNYGRYGEVSAALAAAYVNDSLALIREQEAALAKYSAQVTSYANDVNAYSNNVSGVIGKYREDINNEMAGIQNSNVAVAKYQAQIAGAKLALDKYASQVSSFQISVGQYQQEVSAFSANIGAIVQRATANATLVEHYINIAGRYLASGQAKINEMLSSLGLKAEFRFYSSSSEQFT
jgi:hypothetical protein